MEQQAEDGCSLTDWNNAGALILIPWFTFSLFYVFSLSACDSRGDGCKAVWRHRAVYTEALDDDGDGGDVEDVGWMINWFNEIPWLLKMNHSSLQQSLQRGAAVIQHWHVLKKWISTHIIFINKYQHWWTNTWFILMLCCTLEDSDIPLLSVRTLETTFLSAVSLRT